MIKVQDVIRIKIPFPNIDSNLATNAHMYICIEAQYPKYQFVKCQTLKPYMIINNIIQNYHDEAPDISRNPFKHKTRIDCDKIFFTSKVNYDEKLLTTTRQDICNELFSDIKNKLNPYDIEIIALNEEELISVNNLITYIEKILIS